jgi:hypothetical protein
VDSEKACGIDLDHPRVVLRVSREGGKVRETSVALVVTSILLMLLMGVSFMGIFISECR